MPPRDGRLLLVSQRPIDLRGGASVRWRYLLQTLPELGWNVETVWGGGDPAGTATLLARTRSRRARNALRAGARVAWAALRPLGLNPSLLAHWNIIRRSKLVPSTARLAATTTPAAPTPTTTTTGTAPAAH